MTNNEAVSIIEDTIRRNPQAFYRDVDRAEASPTAGMEHGEIFPLIKSLIPADKWYFALGVLCRFVYNATRTPELECFCSTCRQCKYWGIVDGCMYNGEEDAD